MIQTMRCVLMTSIFVSTFGCTPIPNSVCTREYNPVCGNSTTFPNSCVARSRGFHGHCERFMHEGQCTATTTNNACTSQQFMSEKGMCVTKPWSDFNSCEEEKQQGACPNGHDPNPWVGEHCAHTCGVFVQTSRRDDRGVD